MIDADPAAWLTASEVEAPLTQLLGRKVTAVDAWICQRLAGGAGETLGVWEVTGTATVDGASRPWALVLKGWACAAVASEPTAWNWPYRELRSRKMDIQTRSAPGTAGDRSPTLSTIIGG